MNKKFYEAPATEVVEVKLESRLLTTSTEEVEMIEEISNPFMQSGGSSLYGSEITW